MEMIGAKSKYMFSAASTVGDEFVRDRISDLPWEILDNILGRLPSKDAVATTILSRKWKDKWVDVSKLVFDDYWSWKAQRNAKFIRHIYHVLLSHRGTIEKFVLTICGSESFLSNNDIDTIITFLSRREIKELTLTFSLLHTLPPSLFSCEKLRNVSLTNSLLSLPDNISGFRALVSLHLIVHWPHTDEKLEEMINSFGTNLKILVLANTGFKRLTICAPNLRYLSLEGDFEEVYLESCLHLNDASFKMTSKVEGTSHKMMVQPPNWIFCSRRLVMTGHFLKFLAKMGNWSGVSIDFHNLEVLELDTVHFYDPDEFTIALSILRSSTNLNTLLINGIGTCKEGSSIFPEAHSQRIEKCCFNKLRVVRITLERVHNIKMIVRYRKEMEPNDEEKCFPEVIRLILAGSPILEKMHVHYNYLEACDLWFMRKLLLCERASSQLKLTYKSTQVYP